MVRAIVHKEDDRYLLEISSAEGEEAGLEDGQELMVSFKPIRVEMTEEEFDVMVRRIIEEHREALDYLADH